MQPSPARDVNIRRTEPLISPVDLEKEFPLTPEVEATVLEGRRQIQAALRGEDPRFLVIMGPCSIHDEKAALDYAERLKKLSDEISDRVLIVMRVYFEKPRTTVGWKGLLYDPHLNDTFDINEGLRRARNLLTKIGEMGVFTGTEFLDPIVPQYLAGMVSWAAIGARTTESQTHRQMASGLSMPVGFKNGTDGSAQIAVDAMISARAPHAFLGIDHFGQTCIVQTNGNAYGHLVLRGGNTGPNFGADAIAEANALLTKFDVPVQLLVDCSHGNSNKDHTRQGIALRDIIEQRVAGNANIIGCMLESNISAGAQKLNGDASTLEYGVSITDACIGWEDTEELLRWAHGKMADAVGQPVA
ncbi:MAG: 3-deoxy-7-phosphoheptulonate synthase [Chloroflexi bacterium]|nr:3-deoxy-7-phosphoheptulonate synthase [Chloroflexota bacterium]MDA1228087.1 3-deoxy-7-phosphoheptulonate synthase [Chloroflexota bacterium]